MWVVTVSRLAIGIMAPKLMFQVSFDWPLYVT